MIPVKDRTLSFTDLCRTVEKRLCEIGSLEPDQFPVTKRDVIRFGKTAGVYFCLHGPRSVKLTAICDFARQCVIFYGSNGQRSEEMRAVVSRSLRQVA